MPDTSLRVYRTVRLSVALVSLHHRPHTDPCPGMIAHDLQPTTPHGETFLSGDMLLVRYTQHTLLHHAGSNEKYQEHNERQKKEQKFFP